MQVQLLIDAVIRQTTVLIAQRATAGGVRAPLAHLANHVFIELASELERQGVSRKVSADMFGMALRGYQRRLQRMTESSTDRGRSLWEAVLDHIASHGICTRGQILLRFANDDQVQVRSMLHDLTESGLVFCSGSGDRSAYRAATPEELGAMREALSDDSVDELVWLTVFRRGPLTRQALQQSLRLKQESIVSTLERLVDAGRLEHDANDDAYSSAEFYIPLGASIGWAAAVVDHFEAMVRTICAKLEARASDDADLIGGSTYTFVVWPGHPEEEAVCGELRRYRERLSQLRRRVDEHNREVGVPASHVEVVSYAGQCVIETSKTMEGSDVVPA